jgi:hypothetical protein
LDLEKDPAYGLDHNTTSNYRSVCSTHIKPKLGEFSIAVLDRGLVREFLLGLTVIKRKHGKKIECEAQPATKANVRACLQAIWHHHFPNQVCPFIGLRLNSKKAENARRRAAAKDGDVRALLGQHTYTAQEIERILVAAAAYDEAQRPNVRGVFVPNSPHVIACILGLGTRIDELPDIRWKLVDWKAGAVFIPGVKSASAPRWVPLQESLVPWLRELENLQGSPQSRDYVIQTRPGIVERASKKTYQARIGRILTRAELKLPQKLTHIFRATYGSHLGAPDVGISPEYVKFYLGHGDVFGGATDNYVEMMRERMTDAHRRAIQLPTPAEIRAAVQSRR